MNTTNSGIDQLTISKVEALKDTNGNNYKILGKMANGDLTRSVAYDSANGRLSLSRGMTDVEYLNASDLGVTGTITEEALVDAALRAGLLTIGTTPDAFTQTSTNSVAGGPYSNVDYELKDWRTIPSLADELLNSDDVDAENKYDKTIAEINAQDKKLQLEQTSIEVEYKAVTSEKESVKKILDTNAQASFKYFS